MLNSAALDQRPSLNGALFNPVPAHASVLVIRSAEGVPFQADPLRRRLVNDIRQWLVSGRKFPRLPLTEVSFANGVEGVVDGSRAIVSSRFQNLESATWHFTLRHVADHPANSKLIWRVRGVIATEQERLVVTTIVDCGARNESILERPMGALATTPRFLKDWVASTNSLRVTSAGGEQYALTNFCAEDNELHARIMKNVLLSERRRIPVVLITPNLLGNMPIDPKTTRSALGTSSIVIGVNPTNFNAQKGALSAVIKEVSGITILPAGVYVFLPIEAGQTAPVVQDYDMRSGVDIVNGYLRRVAGDTLQSRIQDIIANNPLVGVDLFGEH